MFHRKSKIDIPPADVALSISESSLTKIMEKKNQKTLRRVTKLIQKAIKHGQNSCTILEYDIGDIEFLKDYLTRLEYSFKKTNMKVPYEWTSHNEQALKIMWGDSDDSEIQETPEEKFLKQEPKHLLTGLGFVVDE
jgi:hypothetical protein